MARLEPTKETIRLLFARSGNQCAFPGCTHELINERNKFIAQVCHIRAAELGGERFDESYTPEQLRAPENLLILCYRHHVETDDVAEFTVERLQKIKNAHESKFKEAAFSVSEALIDHIHAESTEYWKRVHVLNRQAHSMPEFSIEVHADDAPLEIVRRLQEAIQNLEAFVESVTETLASDTKHFETVCLAIPNWLQTIHILLAQLEIRAMETEVARAPENIQLRDSLSVLRARFEEVAQHAICRD